MVKGGPVPIEKHPEAEILELVRAEAEGLTLWEGDEPEIP
jgi:hypothetical protein